MIHNAAMKIQSLIFPLLVSTQAFAGTNVIYGKDNRKDIFQETNTRLLEISESIAGLVHKKDINPVLNTSTRRVFREQPTMKMMCEEESFIDQRVLPKCTGFLFEKNKILTASHCVANSKDCQDFKWVFDFEMEDEFTLSKKFLRQKNVYSCTKVLDQGFKSGLDYILIELDRSVSDRLPLELSTDEVNPQEELVTIGHPSGLPLKVIDEGFIKKIQNNVYYVNLDSYKGNSGAPVIVKNSGKIIGMISSGKADFYFDANSDCFRSNKCDETGERCSVDSKVEMEKVISSEAIIKSISSQIRR
jgi:hypothetical protein